MSGPENKKALQSPSPDELESQKLEEAIVTSNRLIAEMQALLEASRKSQKEHAALIAKLKEERARRKK